MKPVPELFQVACTQYFVCALAVLRTLPSSASKMLMLPSMVPTSSTAFSLFLHVCLHYIVGAGSVADQQCMCL